jgi:2-dehydropantoate 2-reductase
VFFSKKGKFMRVLVVGAGAIGGYFGGRLLEAERDVTFLVRPQRAAELTERGLRIRSPFGHVFIASPATVQANTLSDTFDLIILSCKAYDLESAIESFAPAVGKETAILPLLNGMRHLDLLQDRFGRERVLGGQCLIAASLNQEREITHLNDTHELSFGELDGLISQRVQAIAALMKGVRFQAQASAQILQEMWEKWVFLASAASSHCLMRASVGDIQASPGGKDFVLGMIDECCSIAAGEGYEVREASLKRTHDMLTAEGSSLTASMLRDMERNAPIEADHIVGDLLARRTVAPSISRLAIAYTHMKAYENRRRRAA